MLNDYKPTHDPNIDTFKVQYLLGGSAVLAVLFPYRYQITEVSTTLCSKFPLVVVMLKKLCKRRFFGHFPSGSNQSQFFHNYLCCSEQAKPKR